MAAQQILVLLVFVRIEVGKPFTLNAVKLKETAVSRSRKKVAVLKDNNGAGRKRYWKHLSARAFRRNPDPDDVGLVSDRRYHRHVDSWDVCDFRVPYYGPDDPWSLPRYKYLMK